MSLSLTSFLENDFSLLGDSQVVLHGQSASPVAVTVLDVAYQITDRALNVGSTDTFFIAIDGSRFHVPMYEWASLEAESAGAGISGIDVFDEDGSKYITVGRTSANQVLIYSLPSARSGADAFTFTGTATVSLYTRQYLGGLLDLRVHSAGVKHTVAMITRSASVPTGNPGNPHYNGRELSVITTDGVIWRPAGVYHLSGSDPLYFAFGEAHFDPLRGVWTVQDSWTVIAADSNSANITYGPSLEGPWDTNNYDFNGGTHLYARLRNSNGSFTVRSIAPSNRGIENDWRLLSETYLNGSSWQAEPFTTHLAFDFYPADFRFMKMTFDWAAISGVTNSVTHYDRSTGFMDPADVVCAPIATRDRSMFAAKVAGRVFQTQFNRVSGTFISRYSGANQAGNNNNVVLQWQFEGDADGNLPCKVWRSLVRGSGALSRQGWIRIWVM